MFLGAGGRLRHAGPGLFLVYAFCGVFVFLILRALGELVLHRPSSGSFVSYAREFFGEKAAYVAGWMYFLNWAMTSIVDSTAIATYFHFWSAFEPIPQWLIALIALAVVLGMNLISVKVFGELEFWAALIKVLALVTFLVAGTIFLAGRYHIQGQSTGFSVIANNGGLFPTGLFPLVHRHVRCCLRLCRSRTRRNGSRRDGQPREDHAARDQLGDRPDRVVLCRFAVPARSAAPVHHVQGQREPVRHVLLQDRCRAAQAPS